MFNRFAAPSLYGLSTLGWMCPVKREQARREWKSDLSHSRHYSRDRGKGGHELTLSNCDIQ